MGTTFFVMPQQAVIEDSEFLRMIIHGHTSAYAISAFMKKQAETNEKHQRVIAYSNIAERMLRLARDGLIEFYKRSIHGSKDYKLTWEGLELLTHYILLTNSKEVSAKEEISTMVEYIDQVGLDKEAFGLLLTNYNISTTSFVKEFSKYVKQSKGHASSRVRKPVSSVN